MQSVSKRGFTLIELIVVIAILATLAGAVIMALNPIERLAETRDSTRKQTIVTLGSALQEYAISNGSYPQANNSWMQALVTNNNLKSLLPQITNSNFCWGDSTAFPVNNYCYVNGTTVDGITGVWAWTNVESNAELSKCPGTGATSANTYYVWDSNYGKACLKCANGNSSAYIYPGNCNAIQ